MPKIQWNALVNLMMCGLLASAAHFQYSTAQTIARHDEKIQFLEKRVDRLEY